MTTTPDGVENPFAQIKAKQDAAPDTVIDAPTTDVAPSTNPFDRLRDLASTPPPADDDFDPDEAYAESLVDEILPEATAVEAPAAPPVEPSPAPEVVEEAPKKEAPAKRKRRAPQKSVAPKSAQPATAPTASPSDDITSIALTKPADAAWVELTDIIDSAEGVEDEKASAEKALEDAKARAEETAKELTDAKQQLVTAQGELLAAQRAIEIAQQRLDSADTAHTEAVDSGTEVFERLNEISAKAEKVVERAGRALAARDAVSTLLTTLTGGQSGTFGTVRVTFLDGNPHIEQVTPAATPGKDTSAS